MASPSKTSVVEANKQLSRMFAQMQAQEESFRTTVEEKDRALESLRQEVAELRRRDEWRSSELDAAREETQQLRKALEHIAMVAREQRVTSPTVNEDEPYLQGGNSNASLHAIGSDDEDE